MTAGATMPRSDIKKAVTGVNVFCFFQAAPCANFIRHQASAVTDMEYSLTGFNGQCPKPLGSLRINAYIYCAGGLDLGISVAWGDRNYNENFGSGLVLFTEGTFIAAATECRNQCFGGASSVAELLSNRTNCAGISFVRAVNAATCIYSYQLAFYFS
jgi:hypothetical protein